MQSDQQREPWRRAVFRFSALRGIELVTLVAVLTLVDVVSVLAHGSINDFSIFMPFVAVFALYIAFAYVAVSATAFLLHWLFLKPQLLGLTNSLPLLVWGGFALLLLFGLAAPLNYLVALVVTVFVNWHAARQFENI